MARRRLAVAVLLPTDVRAEVDGIRRAVGADPGYIPPHVTLVPPVNVAEELLVGALGVLREAGERMGSSLGLTIGPPTTFLPRSPVLYLGVSGEVQRLLELKQACSEVPLDRVDPRPFVPHVTLTNRVDPQYAAAASELLAYYRVDVQIERVHLLEQVVTAEQGRHWDVLADAPLGRRHVVGRGGLELVLTTTELVDPEIAAFLRGDTAMSDAVERATTRPQVVITGRRHAEIVGAGIIDVDGSRMELTELRVDGRHRREGIGRHLVTALETEAARRGARSLDAVTPPADAPIRSLLVSCGWIELDDPAGVRRLARRLVPA